MRIVGVTACTVGIAHTYLAEQKLEDAAKKAGDDIKLETQGTIGTEHKLTQSDIDKADIVILAVDVRIDGEERFKNKKTVKVSTEVAIKSPNKLIAKLHELANK